MRIRICAVPSIIAVVHLLAACSSNDNGAVFNPNLGGMPSVGGGTATGTGATSPVGSGSGGASQGQGGGVASQGGTNASNGGTGTAQVGGSTGQGGSVATQGGSTVVATGGSTAVGGSGTTTGGKAAGGASIATGGSTTTGGKAAGGTSANVGGGSATAGGAAATGGAAGAATENIFTLGPYTGAGWVAGGTNLTTFTNPTVNGTTQTFASKTALCMTASVPALQACGGAVTCSGTETKNYAENWGAMLAINTTATEGTPKGNTFSTIAVTYAGTVTPASAQVRLQLELKDGTTYCVNGYASGLNVAVSSFIKNCYDSASTTALTQAQTATITSVQLSIASTDVAETITNLCMTDIKLDGSTTTTPTTTCNDTATASNTLTGANSYATIPTSSGNKSYILQSNWWTSYAGQSEAYSGLGFTVNGSGSFVAADKPLGYPSLFIGSYVNQTSTGSNLPKQVSSLTTVPTVYQWSGSSDISRFNAAYDVWFTQSNAKVTSGNPGSGGAYLMVWMFLPSNQTPRGTVANSSVTIPGAPGTWQVWYDNTNPPCVSYVANTKLTSISFDLNEFIKNAVTNKWGVTNSQYLSIIFGGFEIWEGHAGLKLDKFCAQVN